MKEASVAKKDEETGMDRRGFLECMAWVGTGAVWTMSSGVLKGMPLGQTGKMPMAHGGGSGAGVSWLVPAAHSSE